MILTKQKVYFMGQTPTDRDLLLKWVETAGRLCWKSEDKITDTSAPGFLKNILKKGHTSVLEHSNIVLELGGHANLTSMKVILGERLAFHQLDDSTGAVLINGNIRAWLETIEPWELDTHDITGAIKRAVLFYLSPLVESLPKHSLLLPRASILSGDEIPMELRKYTFRIVCNRAMTHEIVRHRRDCAYSQESQRYVSYENDKMLFIIPIWAKELLDGALYSNVEDPNTMIWLEVMKTAEQAYSTMRMLKQTPQQARGVLPNDVKTEIIATFGYESLHHFFTLRRGAGADPTIQELTHSMYNQFYHGAKDV